ncbi:rhombosortase [Acinetobacter shaoyimingii]|uniref:Rhombosortase n=1 Tax=Acinetobacter shaoyimingii TaxID=2715164 RepID=A0A6G8RYL5_9GAMM|nr:rhombosortase [Acinetobacter shaoyimingii]NHB58001.1 rhombosortase [Acinetobacter shaoyimingii]QIO06961.1 rhombosortase [Acinetobacter shaoyimingii]
MNEKILVQKVLLLAICVCISGCLQVYQHFFIYWRPSFFEEIWRWWTAHWVHVGWMHFVLNMVAFACLPFLFPRASNRYLIILLLLLPPLVSLSFYFDHPDVEAYAGLSGVLHGMYVALAIYFFQYKEERIFSLMVLGFVAIKIVWELTLGSFATSELIGSPVLIEAHYIGAIWGALLSLMFIFYRLYFDKHHYIEKNIDVIE